VRGTCQTWPPCRPQLGSASDSTQGQKLLQHSLSFSGALAEGKFKSNSIFFLGPKWSTGFQGPLWSNSTWMTKICSSNLPFTGGEEKDSQSMVPRMYFVLGDECNFQKFPPTWLKLLKPFFSWDLAKGRWWEDPALCLMLVKQQCALPVFGGCYGSYCGCLQLCIIMYLTQSSYFSVFSVGQNEDPAGCCFPPALLELENTTSNWWRLSRNGSSKPPVNRNAKVNAFILI